MAAIAFGTFSRVSAGSARVRYRYQKFRCLMGPYAALDSAFLPGRSQVVGRKREHHRTAGAEIEDEAAHVFLGRIRRLHRVEPFVSVLAHKQAE